MIKLGLRDSTLTARKGLWQNVSLPLNALRLITMIIPGTFSWRVVQSSQQQGYYNLDLLAESAFEALLKELAEMTAAASPGHLRGIKFCLMDYEGHWTIFSLGDVSRSRVPFLETIGRCRPRRLEKLNAWLDSRPETRLTGGLGSRAVLNREGFRRGENRFVAWKDVEKIRVESVNFAHALLVLPKGRSGSMWDFKRYAFSVRNIADKKKELYLAECAFWQALSTRERENTRQEPAR